MKFQFRFRVALLVATNLLLLVQSVSGSTGVANPENNEQQQQIPQQGSPQSQGGPQLQQLQQQINGKKRRFNAERRTNLL